MTAVVVETVRQTSILRFRRPILTTEAVVEATRALQDMGSCSSAVVVTSEHPRIFLAGAHLGEIAGLDPWSSRAYAEGGRRLMKTLLGLPIAVVAAVHGACAGGGLDLALACDWIAAAPNARFGHPGVLRGLVTGWGGTALLPRRLGRRGALALLAEARLIAAAEAAKIGLVDEIGDEATECALRRGRALAALNPRRLTLWRAFRNAGFIDISGVNVVHTK